MADRSKMPEEWLKLISSERKSYDGPDRYKHLISLYRRATESIPVNQFGHNNTAYAKILVDFAKLRALTSEDDARSIFQAAKTTVKHCSLVYVAWAQFELLHSNAAKCEKLLKKGKLLYAKPKYLLDMALENFSSGNVQLIDEETEEHTFTELIYNTSKTEEDIDSFLKLEPKRSDSSLDSTSSAALSSPDSREKAAESSEKENDSSKFVLQDRKDSTDLSSPDNPQLYSSPQKVDVFTSSGEEPQSKCSMPFAGAHDALLASGTVAKSGITEECQTQTNAGGPITQIRETEQGLSNDQTLISCPGNPDARSFPLPTVTTRQRSSGSSESGDDMDSISLLRKIRALSTKKSSQSNFTAPQTTKATPQHSEPISASKCPVSGSSAKDRNQSRGLKRLAFIGLPQRATKPIKDEEDNLGDEFDKLKKDRVTSAGQVNSQRAQDNFSKPDSELVDSVYAFPKTTDSDNDHKFSKPNSIYERRKLENTRVCSTSSNERSFKFDCSAGLKAPTKPESHHAFQDPNQNYVQRPVQLENPPRQACQNSVQQDSSFPAKKHAQPNHNLASTITKTSHSADPNNRGDPPMTIGYEDSGSTKAGLSTAYTMKPSNSFNHARITGLPFTLPSNPMNPGDSDIQSGIVGPRNTRDTDSGPSSVNPLNSNNFINQPRNGASTNGGPCSSYSSNSSHVVNHPVNVQSIQKPGQQVFQQPLHHPVQQGVQQPLHNPVQQIVQQPLHHPVQQGVQQPLHHPVQQGVQQPLHHPVQQGVQQPLHDPVQQGVQQPLHHPVQQGVQQPLHHPVQQGVQQPLHHPVQQGVQQPLHHPVQQSVHHRIQQPAQQPISHAGQHAAHQRLHSSYNPRNSGSQSIHGVRPGYPIPAPFANSSNNIVVVNNKVYNKLNIIGKGGSSKVYKVFDGEKEYAIKYVNVEDADSEVVQSYVNEITLLKRLQGHESIIKLYDWEMNDEEKVIKIVLEIGSTDLAGYLRKNPGKITIDFIKVCWKQILDAVQVVHEEGIVHTDLKPANFLLVEWNLKLIDFGIANAIQADHTSFFRDSQIGTLNYMSPEALKDISQAPGPNEHHRPMMKIGRASDVWSLGCILYLMVYGKTPFQHIPHRVQKWKCIMDPTYEIKFPPIENQDLIDTMKGCLRRNPRERYTIPQLQNHPFLTGRTSERNVESVLNYIMQMKDINSPTTLRTLTQNMLQQLSSGGALDMASVQPCQSTQRESRICQPSRQPLHQNISSSVAQERKKNQYSAASLACDKENAVPKSIR